MQVYTFVYFELTQVFMVDPATPDGVEMTEYIKLFLDHYVPARLGLVLLPSDEVGVALSQGFSFLVEHKSAREAFKWMVKVSQTCISLTSGCDHNNVVYWS